VKTEKKLESRLLDSEWIPLCAQCSVLSVLMPMLTHFVQFLICKHFEILQFMHLYVSFTHLESQLWVEKLLTVIRVLP